MKKESALLTAKNIMATYQEKVGQYTREHYEGKIVEAILKASPIVVLPALPNSLDNTDVAKAYRGALDDLKKLNPDVEFEE